MEAPHQIDDNEVAGAVRYDSESCTWTLVTWEDAPAPAAAAVSAFDLDDLDSLLIEALDGADQRRAAFLLRWRFLIMDAEDRDERDRLRRDGPPPEFFW